MQKVRSENVRKKIQSEYHESEGEFQKKNKENGREEMTKLQM